MSTTLADWARFPEDAYVIHASRAERQRFGLEPWILGSFAFAAYVTLGTWLATNIGVMGDAYARVAQAHFVLFGQDPHLAAIGFVWNPLPTLMMLPLVAFKNVWPQLVEQGLAANLVSAFFGGIAAFYMARLLRRLILPRWLRLCTVMLFLTNPAIAFHAANGLTEIQLTATLIAATDGLVGYLKDRHLGWLIASGMWVAVGFAIRPEVVVWAAFVVIAIAIGVMRAPSADIPAQRQRDWASGLTVLWLAPCVYAASTWMFLNWAIVGDAFHFARSVYRDPGLRRGSGAVAQAVVAADGDVAATLEYGSRLILLFPPALLAIVALVVYGFKGRKERNTWALIFFAGALGVSLFNLVMLYAGAGAGTVRFFITTIPFTIIGLVYVARLLRRGILRTTGTISCVALLALGNATTYQGLQQPGKIIETEPMMMFRSAEPFVSFFDGHPELEVLTDSFLSYPLLLRTERPEQFVITSDRHFEEALAAPHAYVDALLIPEPVDTGQLDAINRRYPSMWANGASWLRLRATFPASEPGEYPIGVFEWRLYEIVDEPPAD